MRYNQLNSGDLGRELQHLEEFTREPTLPFVYLETLTAAPVKTVTGMVALADGVLWNPGAGAGVYCYRGGAWQFLG